MRRLSIILILLFPLTIKGQNPHDSLTIIYKSDNLIEIVKPQFPEIAKSTTPLANNIILDGVYIDPKKYGVLKNGEINIFDRFYQLIEHIVYRDSLRILVENYENGKLKNQYRHIFKDSTTICTYYFDNGNMKIQDNTAPEKETTTKWHENGSVKSICIYKDKQEKCDYWDDNGFYKNGIITIYKGHKDFVISEIEIDNNGKEVRKIK